MRYRERKAVRAALDWISNLLTSYDTRERERSNHMQRLSAAGVTPWEVLRAVLAVWIYQEWAPDKLPSDSRLTHNLANIVLRLAPLPRRPTPGGRSSERGVSLRMRLQLGELLREVLFPLCGKMYAHDMAEFRRQEELKRAIADFGGEG